MKGPSCWLGRSSHPSGHGDCPKKLPKSREQTFKRPLSSCNKIVLDFVCFCDFVNKICLKVKRKNKNDEF